MKNVKWCSACGDAELRVRTGQSRGNMQPAISGALGSDAPVSSKLEQANEYRIGVGVYQWKKCILVTTIYSQE